MKKIKEIVGINLLILLIYTLLTNFLTPSQQYRELGIMFTLMVAIAAQVIINLIVSGAMFYNKDKPLGKTFLLGAGVVLLVGFSACIGTGSL
ncbi:hypothetical protein R9C00_16030 [Flammeovirgaceae bacterium SG7u.111]|nr:hypothetical protein [Flammeovirgaceae bacterium SG7u.132]WPO33211.1 hypothetical protein R9C00_16030 [Flammeovirgaceae bacterium SG7u.111]